ncbi:methyl-accepting chemotaxis protein, partial [Acidovorax cattleyae]|nr:methyl-accepting chemotaxis protein [Paracidovorax cattleyae]
MAWDGWRTGTRLVLAFGSVALLVAGLMGVGLSDIGRAQDAHRAALEAASALPDAAQRAPI